MAKGSEIMVDRETGTVVINETDVDTRTALRAAYQTGEGSIKQLFHDPMMDAIVTWTSSIRGGSHRTRKGGIFDRDRFVSPTGVFDKMRVAEDATTDDIVASFLDSSEALAFTRINIECDDEDEEDIWQQIGDDIDLGNRMREIWRELNIYSQSYVATWFGTKSYQVRGKSETTDVRRKKKYDNLQVPLGITTLDPFKVIPVGNFLFNQETLTYFADPTERDVIDSWLLGDDASGADPIIRRLIIGKYEPDFRDRKEIGNFGVDPNRLYILNPKYVWRHTVTKSGWQRFPQIRMESTFQLLDLKQQLRQMDRAALLGATNFITLIKKGTDKEPAKPAEIGALQEQVKTISQVPVIVGDHRLTVEIITPKTDHTLDADRYLGLDIRISGRLYGMFLSTHAGRDDSLKLARVVARGLESRRDQQRRSFVNNVLMPTYHLNDQLKEVPRMAFHPKSIALDFDPSRATYLLDLRDRGDLSRQSVLSEIDYDEAEEARKVKLEIQKYNKIFQPGQDPETGLPLDQGGTEKTPAESLNYKDVPPDVKRQIEKQAGLTPSKMDPAQLPPTAGGTKMPAPVVPGGVAKKAPGAKKAAGATKTPKPGDPNDPKRAGRALGGNHGKGGNGNIGRGAGQEAKPRPSKPAKVSGQTVSYDNTGKGQKTNPPGPKKMAAQRKSPSAQQKKESAADANVGRTSGMVSLDIPKGVIPPVPNGVEDHHITVVYLGSNVSDETLEAVLGKAEMVASLTRGPLEGIVGGIGTFPPSDSSDGLTPVFMVPAVDGLDEIRNEFEDFNASQHSDFHPHVTLTYLEDGEEMPNVPDQIPVQFDGLSVHCRDEVWQFPFGSGE